MLIPPIISKHSLRIANKQRRNTLQLQEVRQAAASICANIIKLHQYQSSKTIAIYDAIKGEINLSAVQQDAHAANKTCYLPKIVANNTLLFLPVNTQTTFTKHAYGIREPNVNHDLACPPQQIDIIFIPLLAFDKYGTRLGMGGGYYDKTLAQHRPKLLIGVAYEFQQQDFIPPDPWDVSLSAVVTEQGIHWMEKL